MPEITEDETYFGRGVYVYCDQHLRPHSTGWCTVSVKHKVGLSADTIESAYAECESRGFKIFKG